MDVSLFNFRKFQYYYCQNVSKNIIFIQIETSLSIQKQNMFNHSFGFLLCNMLVCLMSIGSQCFYMNYCAFQLE